ncbi:MAG: hypothetical protein HQL52_07860 [Magnetococcales bacterium]|nr:hypothetical protein [Magnetococcales bacterium]
MSGMAKRHKRKKRTRSATPGQLFQKGKDLLAAGQFRQAIENLKSLNKQEPGGQGCELLITAYWGRAKELFDKGLFREAAVTLEQADRLNGARIDTSLLLSAWCNAGLHVKAARLWGEKNTDTPEFSHTPVAELLACLAVVDEEIANALGTDHPVGRHLIHARQAIQALILDRQQEAREATKQIPVRSSLRSLRLLLLGILATRSNPESAMGILERIPVDSPLSPIARVLIPLAQGKQPQPDSEGDSEGSAYKMALFLEGVEKPAQELLGQIERSRSRPDRLFSILLNDRWANLIPEQIGRQICGSLLDQHPRGLSKYNKKFGLLPAWRRHRMAALEEERKGYLDTALDQWQLCVGRLEAEDEDLPEAEKGPVRAALFRHMGDLANKVSQLDEKDHWADSWSEPIAEQRFSEIKYLERSLESDPSDRQVYLRLIHLHEKKGNAKQRRQAVQRAVKHFPEDPEVLEAAMNEAFDGGAFKKAVKLAGQILERNPINNPVRRQVVKGHLMHARKKIKSGRQDLAEKELKLAETVERPQIRDGSVQICRGVMALMAGDKRQADIHMKQARQEANHACVADLMALMEAERIIVSQSLFGALKKKLTASLKDTSPEPGLLLDLIERIEASGREPSLNPKAWIPALSTWLNKCARLPLPVDQRRLVCHFLADHEGFKPLGAFAREGIKKWPGDPSFLFFQLFAKYEGDEYRVPYRDLNRLDDAMMEAGSTLDHRTQDRIGHFMYNSGPPMPFGLPEIPGGIPFDYEEHLDNEKFPIFPEFFDQLEESLEGAKSDPEEAIQAFFSLKALQILAELAPQDRGLTLAEIKAHLYRELVPSFPLGPTEAKRLIDQFMENTSFDEPNPPVIPPVPRKPRKPKKTLHNPRQLEFDFDD